MPTHYRPSEPRPRAPTGATQVQAILTDRLRAGWRTPGQQLPTVREMAGELQVGILIVHRALNRLAELGFITTHGRLGTRVAECPPYLHTIGLVVPVDLAVTPPGMELRWRAMAQAATTFRSPQHRIELFLGLNNHPETSVHRDLQKACADGRLAGLIVPDPRPIAGWFDPLQAGLPLVGTGSFLALKRPQLGDIHPAQVTFFAEALRRSAERGLKRVAVLLHNQAGYALEHLAAAAHQHGIVLTPRHLLGIDPGQPHWAAHAVAAMFHGPEQPEALIIGDDHLVPAATTALAALDRPIFTIAQANFPLEAASAVPCIRLGWDQETFLSLACARIGDHLATGAPIGDHHLPLITSGACS